MWHVWFRVFAALSLLLTQVGCSTGLGGEALTCLTSNDCPPKCECPNPGRFCVTDSNESTPCGGSCDAETSCPDGTSCDLERTEGSVELHSCLPDGAGGTGGAGGDGGAGGTGGSGTLADRCNRSNDVYCNNGYDCEAAGWSVSPEAFEDLYQQDLAACLSFGEPCTTEEAFCEGRDGDTYSAANHEACISGQMTTNCAVDDVGVPVFPAVCDELCVTSP